jgi:monofunctional chorismate mutase
LLSFPRGINDDVCLSGETLVATVTGDKRIADITTSDRVITPLEIRAKARRLKAEHDLPPSDPDREARQVARLRALALEADLDPAFAEKWFNFVVSEVIRHHVRIAEEG